MAPPWTWASLASDRIVFFAEQRDGDPHVWAMLAAVAVLVRCRRDDALALARTLMARHRCTSWAMLWDGVFDAHGREYRIPEWVIVDPKADCLDPNPGVNACAAWDRARAHELLRFGAHNSACRSCRGAFQHVSSKRFFVGRPPSLFRRWIAARRVRRLARRFDQASAVADINGSAPTLSSGVADVSFVPVTPGPVGAQPSSSSTDLQRVRPWPWRRATAAATAAEAESALHCRRRRRRRLMPSSATSSWTTRCAPSASWCT